MQSPVQELSTSAMPSLQQAPSERSAWQWLTQWLAARRAPASAEQASKARRAGRFQWGAGSAAYVLPWLVPLLLVGLWQLASSLGWLSARVLPSPLNVVLAFWNLAVTGELYKHVLVSTQRALLGLAIGGGLGLLLGLLNGSVKWCDALLDSSIQMVRNIPALAMIPLVILWFGIDEAAKLFLIAVAVFFPIYIKPTTALKAWTQAWSKWAVPMGSAAGSCTGRLCCPVPCRRFWWACVFRWV